MAFVVYCIAPTEGQAVRICNRLQAANFLPSDISILHGDPRSLHEVSHVNSTKAPEGAAAGGSAGLLLGGALGWAAGIGALAIPGFGPLIAAGPILAALSGASVGGALGGLAGALVGLGIPEYEAQQYEGRLRKGNFFISVHASTADAASRASTIFDDENAEAIWTGSEAEVPEEPVSTSLPGGVQVPPTMGPGTPIPPTGAPLPPSSIPPVRDHLGVGRTNL